MTISEQTKITVMSQKTTLKQRYEANLKDIAEHQSAIAKIEAMNLELRKEYEALDADIPEPVAVKEELTR